MVKFRLHDYEEVVFNMILTFQKLSSIKMAFLLINSKVV